MAISYIDKQNIKKSLGKNAILNILKQCSNILFPLITYPYISRVLGAENLGKYSFAESIIQYVILFAGIGISTYAIREGARIRENKADIQNFSNEIFSINIISCIISLIVFAILVIKIPQLYNSKHILCILSINVISTTLSRDWLNTIFEDFAYITLRYIVCQLISLVLIFAFVKNREDYVIYTWIMVIGYSGGYLFSTFYTRKYAEIKFVLSKSLVRHMKPIMILFASNLALSVYIHSDVTMLGFFRNDVEVGIYTLSSRIYLIIKAFLNAIITVTIPRLSNLMGKNYIDDYYHLAKKLKKVLITFVFPCVVGLIFLSSDVMLLVGGAEYITGGKSLAILCMATTFAVFGCFYSQVFLVINRKDNIFMIATIISALLNVFLNFVFIPLMGIDGAAITTVISEVVVFLICRFNTNVILISFDRDYINVFLGNIVLSIVCMIVRYNIGQYYLRIIFSILLGGVSYFGILLLFKNTIIIEFVNKLRLRICKK